MTDDQRLASGSDDLRLPDALRGPLRAHLYALRDRYRGRGWGGPVGASTRSWKRRRASWRRPATPCRPAPRAQELSRKKTRAFS